MTSYLEKDSEVPKQLSIAVPMSGSVNPQTEVFPKYNDEESFNNSLLINGFRRLSALEIKMDIEELSNNREKISTSSRSSTDGVINNGKGKGRFLSIFCTKLL